jgi:CheY-like chemotaxis protein
MKRQFRILIVDDDDELRELLRSVLQDEGHTVFDASDGVSALIIARSHTPPQIILSDLQMPLMNGWQLCAELQRDPALATIPFVVLSGEPSDVTHLRSGRPVQHLRKPVRLATLLSMLRSLEVPEEPVSSVRLGASDPGARRASLRNRSGLSHSSLVVPPPGARLRRPVRR